MAFQPDHSGNFPQEFTPCPKCWKIGIYYIRPSGHFDKDGDFNMTFGARWRCKYCKWETLFQHEAFPQIPPPISEGCAAPSMLTNETSKTDIHEPGTGDKTSLREQKERISPPINNAYVEEGCEQFSTPATASEQHGSDGMPPLRGPHRKPDSASAGKQLVACPECNGHWIDFDPKSGQFQCRDCDDVTWSFAATPATESESRFAEGQYIEPRKPDKERYWVFWERVNREDYRSADAQGKCVMRLNDPLHNNQWIYFVDSATPSGGQSTTAKRWSVLKDDDKIWIAGSGNGAIMTPVVWSPAIEKVLNEATNAHNATLQPQLPKEDYDNLVRDAMLWRHQNANPQPF